MMRYFIGILFVFVLSCFAAAQSQSRYLVPGVGIKGEIEIGQEDTMGVGEGIGNDSSWMDYKAGLKYKADASGIIVLIKCENSNYATDENILVGSPESDVLRRYGAPRKENSSGKDVLYRYPGIAFTIQDRQVKSIYIFPKYLESR